MNIGAHGSEVETTPRVHSNYKLDYELTRPAIPRHTKHTMLSHLHAADISSAILAYQSM